MKALVFVLLCSTCVGGLSCRQATLSSSTAQEKWVVLSEAEEFNSIWTPREANIPELIRGAAVYLQQLANASSSDYLHNEIQKMKSEYLKREIQDITSQWDDYVCQVIGYTKDEKRLIHLNFLLPASATKWDVDWRKEFIQVNDGGAAFWQVDFDPEEKLYLNFHPSGHG